MTKIVLKDLVEKEEDLRYVDEFSDKERAFVINSKSWDVSPKSKINFIIKLKKLYEKVPNLNNYSTALLLGQNIALKYDDATFDEYVTVAADPKHFGMHENKYSDKLFRFMAFKEDDLRNQNEEKSNQKIKKL